MSEEPLPSSLDMQMNVPAPSWQRARCFQREFLLRITLLTSRLICPVC
ncbi:MAG: hypothetical protein R3A10_04770 [Caldilineaceae bacterium]